MRLLTLLLIGCAASKAPATPAPVEEAPPAPAAEPAPEPAAASSRPVWKPKVHMDRHFAFSSDALFGLIQGDLSEVKAQAIELSEHETAEVPKDWAPMVDQMLAETRKLEKAETTEDAAKQLMSVVATCANCHQAIKGPDVDLKGLVADHALFGETGMERHEWAVFRMWMGLIVPDAEMFNVGATGLTLEEGVFPDFPDEVKPLHAAVVEGGKKALEAGTDVDRRAAFAALVPICAECHTTLDVEMK